MKVVHAKESSIVVCFGDKLHGETQVDLQITIDLFSQKNQNRRFNLGELLNTEIGNNSVVVELDSKKGDAQALAKEISQMDIVKQGNESGQKQIQCFGNGNKIYLVLSSKIFSEKIQPISDMLAHLKDTHTGTNNQINLRIQSQYDLKHIGETLAQKGMLMAYTESLQIAFNFKKTELIQNFLATIFQNILCAPQIVPALKCFTQLNVELNLSSARTLKQYQKVQLHQFVTQKSENQFSDYLIKHMKQHISFSLFNETVSLTGNGTFNGFEPFLKTIFL